MFVSASLVLGLATVAPQDAASSPLDQSVANQPRAYALARPNPGINFSPGGAARYAMAQGCIPHIATGRSAREFMRTSAMDRISDVPGQYNVTTAVTLREDPSGSCTIVVAGGNPEGLRTDMLEVMDENGAQRVAREDSGPGLPGPNASLRQELHCVTLDGTLMSLRMLTSSVEILPRMIATLGRDEAGECMRGSAS